MNGSLRALLCALALTVSPLAAAVPILTVAPVDSTLQVGETTRVDVRVEGLVDEFVGAYDLTIRWAGALLGASNLQFDVFLDGPADSLQLPGVVGSGSASAVEVSFSTLANQTGFCGFRLFSFDLTAIGAGTTALEFDASAPLALVAGDGSEFSAVQLVAGRIAVEERVTAVPEPAMGALLALAGLALVGAVRRKVSAG